MAGETLLIRADASTETGTGHVMRCLALAQAWQEAGGRAWTISSGMAEGLAARLAAEEVVLTRLAAPPGSRSDAEETIRHAREAGARWLALDGYHFDAAYQDAVKKAGLGLLVIDDNGHAARYHADLVLNQNISAGESLYPAREPDTRLLLGTRYALLRREFWPWRGWQRPTLPAASRVLVTLGGSDPENVSLKVVQALSEMAEQPQETLLVLGSSNPHGRSLQEAAGRLALNLRLERGVADMSRPMAWADVCLAAGGSTCWELALMGLPSLLFILAANQQANAEALHAAGAAHNLGWHAGVSAATVARETERILRSPELRAAMAGTGQRMVDGHGAPRVVAEMIGRPVVRVRPARKEDLRPLFDWANDPLTRAMSFHPEPISWTEHERWFQRVTARAGAQLLIAEVEQVEGWEPCGQVRIDEDGTVSLAVAPQYRGRRLAVPALRAAVASGRRLDRRELKAFVRPENERSQRVFLQAGFQSAGWAEAGGQPCLSYVYRYPLPAPEGKGGR